MSVSGAWERAARGAMLLDDSGNMRPTIFAEMTALAAHTGAINLGQGFPDEDGPAEVLEAARQAISDGVNQYAPGIGMAVLRNSIAAHQARFYGVRVDPERQVMVTAGATEALAATILALTEEGDEIVALEPFYDAYAAIAGLSKAHWVTVGLRAPHYLPDHDDLRAAVTDRTRLIIVNSPHNPTGTVLPRETLELVVELAHKHDAIIVTDEVYEHLTFDRPHVPVSSLPGAFERTVTISSAGKTFSVTGWKIGWVVAPSDLLNAILAVKQFLTYTIGAPFQPAIAVGLALPDEFFTRTAATLRGKRDLLTSGLTAAGFEVRMPDAGYFVIADAAPLGITNADEFCRALPRIAGVAGVPVTAFVGPRYRSAYSTLVRFAFCKKVDVLERAATQLAQLRR